MQHQAAKLVLTMLQSDAHRLPAGAVIEYLNAALDVAGEDDQFLALIHDSAAAAIAATDDHDDLARLAQIERRCESR